MTHCIQIVCYKKGEGWTKPMTSRSVATFLMIYYRRIQDISHTHTKVDWSVMLVVPHYPSEVFCTVYSSVACRPTSLISHSSLWISCALICLRVIKVLCRKVLVEFAGKIISKRIQIDINTGFKKVITNLSFKACYKPFFVYYFF